MKKYLLMGIVVFLVLSLIIGYLLNENIKKTNEIKTLNQKITESQYSRLAFYMNSIDKLEENTRKKFDEMHKYNDSKTPDEQNKLYFDICKMLTDYQTYYESYSYKNYPDAFIQIDKKIIDIYDKLSRYYYDQGMKFHTTDISELDVQNKYIEFKKALSECDDLFKKLKK